MKGQPQPYLRGHAAWKDSGPKWVEDENGCWIWQRKLNNQGYGVGSFVKDAGKHSYLAHRWNYEQKHGPVADGLVLDHLCKKPACVNPDHLEVVTQRVNVLRTSATKLTDEQVMSAIRMHNGGVPWRKVAEHFGVTHPPLLARVKRLKALLNEN